ncbi:MAG: MliC family protein [Wohlfahrtiimonas sp.]
MKAIIKTAVISTVALGLSLTAYAEQKNSLSEYEVTNTAQFKCAQDTIKIDFINKKQNNAALVTMEGDTVPNLLVNVIAASGEKYVGGIYELWIQGDDAMLTNFMTDPENATDCQIIPAK